MTSINRAVAVVRKQAAAEQSQAGMICHIDADLLEVVLAAAERAEKAEQEAEEWHEAATNLASLAFVDKGANPPISWKERAEEVEGLAMGQAYQIAGHLFAALDDPSHRPTEAAECQVMDYLAAGKYDDDFLPWPSEIKGG